MAQKQIRITARVIESEFVQRDFEIDCGKGSQYISWLASTACLRFGQTHYPKGIYVPNLLTLDDGETTPHPRWRIHEKLNDGDIVHVHLKNKGKKTAAETIEQEEWYENAFGVKQNMMKVSIKFMPQGQLKQNTKSEIYAEVKYDMFEELRQEFSKADFPAETRMILEPLDPEGTALEYDHEFELPYGRVNIKLKQAIKIKKDEELQLTDIPPDENEFFMFNIQPKPISMNDLRVEHNKEEAELKLREQEARLAQKRLEEEKTRLRYEQQQQIAKQEQNTAQLKVYFEAMNLGFHTGEEDFNASMSVLSIYHQELMDNFKFYASLQEQKFHKEENTMIVLQEFIHFMKLMDIAKSKDEASGISESMAEIDGVQIPFTETLNSMNGLNYAQFLEAILRIAYYKKEHGDQSGNPDGFKNTLETMFDDADLDIKKKAKTDPIFQNMYELAHQNFFEENFDLLAAIFSEKGMPKIDHLELSKADFVGLLKEAKCLIIPKPTPKEAAGGKGEKKEEEKKKEEQAPSRKFEESDVYAAIKPTCSFDDDQLNYVDFLEALVRVANAFPFTEEELADMVTFEHKLMYFVQRLEEQYKSLKDIFYSKQEMQFQPRVVVDEDNDEDYDMDG